MATKDDGAKEKNQSSEETSKQKVASAYLWRGFTGDLTLTTFDLFTKVSVVDVALGDSHSLFLTEDGQVFVNGMNNMGQLGMGTLDVTVREEPMKVEGLPEPVTKIACGKYHNAVVADGGQVFCWGSSKEGQCGTGNLDLVLSPTRVPVEINEGFCQHGVPKPRLAVIVNTVACGASHTLAVSTDGEVWAWGCGPQLGLVELLHAPVPRRVDTLQGHTAVAVCCGEKHSMALVLRGDKRSSRSSSPMKTKGKVEAQAVQEDKHYPSRCSVCNKEIYTYTDTNDMCIIDTLHECNVNESMRSVDSTIIEDISASSSSGEVSKKSTPVSPENGDKLSSVKEGKGEEPQVDSIKEKEDSVNESQANAANQSILSDSSMLETSACDTSVLVVAADSPFEDGDTHAISEDSTKDQAAEGDNTAVHSPMKDNSSASPSKEDSLDPQQPAEDKSKVDDASEVVVSVTASDDKNDGTFVGEASGQGNRTDNPENSEDSRMLEVTETKDRTSSVESDDVIWKRRSETEDIEEELKVLGQRKRTRSPSNTSVKSLDLSGAREYLQRQFEEEEEGPGSTGKAGITSSVAKATAKGDKPSTPIGNMFGYSSNMMAQVKSMTNRAFNNFQSFSMFSSSGELSDSQKTQSSGSSEMELSTVPASSVGQEAREKSPEVKASKENPEPNRGSAPEAAASSFVVDQCAVRKSGTFIEWTREMSAVDDDPASLNKDSNQKSLRTIQMQQKNLSRASLSSTSDIPAPTTTHSPVITATDVWVWGCNDQGQLGLGDQLDRAQPTVLKIFIGRHVIKLAAGDYHNLALTANSQVYSWGSNSYGQLGQMDMVHVPTRMKFMKGYTAWDIAAGAAHSIFLGDLATAQPEVLYCGKHPSKESHSSMKKTSSPVSLADIKKLGWISRVMAGGTGCACKVLNPPPPESEALFELAASERAFYNQLIKTTNLLLRPLQKSDFYSSMDVYPYKSSLQNLIMAFGALTKKIGEGITDLTSCIQTAAPLSQTLMLGSHTEVTEAFRNYSKSFSDFLAVGGFDYCTRTGSEFFEKIQGSIRDLSDERDKSVGASSLFMRAMRYPFFRLVEYSRIMSKMAVSVESQESKNQLQSVVLDWDSLKINFSSEHKVADATRAFWESTSPKVADAMRTPERRVLRDSKTYPLQWPSGGRFSARLFVLFNDSLLHLQNTGMTYLPLQTLWVESSTSDADNPNAITIIAPEERFDLLAATPAQKAEWLISLNSAISKVLTTQKSIPSRHSSGERFTPPLIRHATHTFKNGVYKDATYDGTWLSGKIHGIGVLKWQNGTVFEGNFKRGLMHGSGVFTQVKSAGKEIQKGNWKDGKLNGLATVSYANGDLYEGHFQDGQRFGHGMYQAGKHKSSYASVYIGEWLCNMKEGYGVQDDILKGEKYMGMWVEDQRHGNGIMVTLDGMYFEGTFVQNKLTGFGVMISDDNTLYEGDFIGITHLAGKGTLTLPTGDKLEGAFSGSLNEGLKINGTFIKSASTPDVEKRSHPAGVKSKHFGRLCVSPDNKWTDIFSHATSTLGQGHTGVAQGQIDTGKAWEVVAVMVSNGRKALKEGSGISPSKTKAQMFILEGLEKIPSHGTGNLNTETVMELSTYLAKAFDTVYHPLGQLMDTLVDVFRASYIGVGAHPRLLHHAVLEMRSYLARLYRVVRILFPALPANGGPIHVYPPHMSGEMPRTTEEAKEFIEGLEVEDPNIFVLTAPGLLYPILLPKIYPPLFDLYALYNEKNDDRYWERVTKLNRQSDMGLMAYLGIEQRFWLMEEILQQDSTQKLSTIKDICYAEAVDTLQQLSTAFSPLEKLKIIEQTFNEITKTVTLTLKDDHMWCMDDLFPIFQFVVVRAKIHHLGAEIHMVDDLMEPHLEHGEFGLMFTTLKACYFQIQNEKMPHH